MNRLRYLLDFRIVSIEDDEAGTTFEEWMIA